MAPKSLTLFFLLLALVACAPSTQDIAQAVDQTLTASVLEATSTSTVEPATSTPMPSPTPTVTPTIQPTKTPGPFEVTDDFSEPSDIWSDCEACTYEGGTLHLGPFPVTGAYMQHNVICEACGMVTNYRMSADVIFIDGQTDRGFGLMARLNDEELIVYEITTWQTVDLWRYDTATSTWEWLNGTFTGAVRPGKQLNHIEIEAFTNPTGTIDFVLSVNGQTPLVVFSQPAKAGFVGLSLYGHALEVSFDNFFFETFDTPIYPSTLPESSG